MTLDEAIKHAREVAEDKRADADWKFRHGRLNADDCISCAEEHDQLADWLEDYKKLKSIDEDLRLKYCYEDLSEADNLGYLRGYNKAISEVDDLLSADLPISNVLHNINEFILCNNKGIDYDELDTEKECAE